MNASLVLVQSNGNKREIPLVKARTIIGRDTSCQIRIPVPAVSRHHCEVVQEGQKLVIKDLESSNGTFVNRRRVTQTELAAGDIVGVGPAVFAVRMDGNPASIDAEAVLRQASLPIPASPAVSTPAGAPSASASKKSVLDDELSADDSSVADFDFLDDDDQDDQPKL